MEEKKEGMSEIAGVVGMFHQATERLRESHEKLRRKVEDLQRELEEKNAELRRKDRLAILGEMSACLAHEIRNPLNSMGLFASLLGRKCDGDPQKTELVNNIRDGVQRLNRLVEDMLTFTGKTEPAMATIAIEPLIDRALLFAAGKLEEKAIVVEKRCADGGLPLQGDEAMLERVFLNIIMNAAQAMEREGKLTVATQVEGGCVTASFSDTGTGLSPEAMGKLFTPFFTSKRSGTGLGLTIAHRIVESHGGRLTARNNEGRGATFVVSLPLTAAPAREHREEIVR